MAFANSNNYLDGRTPVPTPVGNDVMATRFSLTLKTADLAKDVIGAVGILPAGCVPVALLLDSDDLDSGGSPAAAMTVGVLTADGTAISTDAADGGAAWGTGITISQTGGQVQVLSKALSRVAANNTTDRKIGIKVTTAAATAAAGELGITLLYRSA